MGIKIVDGAETREGPVVAVIYGQPGVGKTTLALTAEKPVLLDFDRGVRRAGNRSGKAVVEIDSWSDVEGLESSDIEDYKTIIVDTIGSCIDAIIRDIVRKDPSMGTAGSLKLQGYGRLKTRFQAWISGLRALKKDVILLAHMTEETRGDRTFERIEAIGSSKNLIYQSADVMGRMVVDEESGHRFLLFNPAVASYGKNPGLPEGVVPPPAKRPDYMGSVIAAAKKALSVDAPTEAQDQTESDDGPPPTPPPPTDENEPPPPVEGEAS